MDNEGDDKSYQACQAIGALILNPSMDVSDEEAIQSSRANQDTPKPNGATQAFKLIEHTCSDDGKNRDDDPLKTHDFTIEMDGQDFLIEPDVALPNVTFGQPQRAVLVLNKLKKAN